MANQRGTFAKRNREMKLKDRAREKAERRAARKSDSSDLAERRAARKSDSSDTKGPQIAWDQPGGTALNDGESEAEQGTEIEAAPDEAPPPAPDTNTDTTPRPPR